MLTVSSFYSDDVVSLGNPELDLLWKLRNDREDEPKDDDGKRKRFVQTNEDATSASAFLRGVHLLEISM